MNQSEINTLEQWFLNHSSKIPIFRLPLDIKTKFNELKLLHENWQFGILVKLPQIKGYTKVILSIKEIDIFVSQEAELKQLNINSVINLVIPEFERGIIPTISELQELLEEAEQKLQKESNITIKF